MLRMLRLRRGGAGAGARGPWPSGSSGVLVVAMLLFAMPSLADADAALGTLSEPPAPPPFASSAPFQTPSAWEGAAPNATLPTALQPGGRRREEQRWDGASLALILGGTLTVLVLASLGGLASKALLASMLAAALSALQLARQPQQPARRPG